MTTILFFFQSRFEPNSPLKIESADPTSIKKETPDTKPAVPSKSRPKRKRYPPKKPESDARNFECDNCGKRFRKKGQIYIHVLFHFRYKNFECNECNKSYKTKMELRQHENSHLKVSNFPCLQCGKFYKTKTLLKMHEKFMHNQVRVFKLLRIPKSGESVIFQFQEKNFRCLCGSAFKMKSDLKRHILLKHSNDERKFSCSICQKSFKTSDQRKKHEQIVHNGKKEYKCEICENEFKTAGNLKQHLMTHDEDRTIVCPVCGKQ
jgi:KRAB domain-containing zinc finger protein